eukprot:9384292-Alexandrium_andersonii.AAC.1
MRNNTNGVLQAFLHTLALQMAGKQQGLRQLRGPETAPCMLDPRKQHLIAPLFQPTDEGARVWERS